MSIYKSLIKTNDVILKSPFRDFIVIFLIVFSVFCPSLTNADSGSEYLELHADPSYFSPNGDGVKDHVFFSPILGTDANVTRWRLWVKTPSRKKINRLSGGGFSALIQWDGRDKKNRVVPDGDYAGQATVWGEKTKLHSKPIRVIVDTVPPLVQMSISTSVTQTEMEDQFSVELKLSVSDLSPIDRWQVQIFDLTGRSIYLHWSSGPATSVIGDGRDLATGALAPQGKYRCSFVAWDMAGNQSKTYFADVVVNVSAREMLEHTLKIIFPIVTDLGLFIQLPAQNVFSFKKGKVELNELAKPRLDEVALIINAYPDVSVDLVGYSKRLKTADLDRDRSSFYAWSLYSYLVKKGNVKASRLSVSGRGRSPMFDRRAVDLKLVPNGIEILLVGDRDW